MASSPPIKLITCGSTSITTHLYHPDQSSAYDSTPQTFNPFSFSPSSPLPLPAPSFYSISSCTYNHNNNVIASSRTYARTCPCPSLSSSHDYDHNISLCHSSGSLLELLQAGPKLTQQNAQSQSFQHNSVLSLAFAAKSRYLSASGFTSTFTEGEGLSLQSNSNATSLSLSPFISIFDLKKKAIVRTPPLPSKSHLISCCVFDPTDTLVCCTTIKNDYPPQNSETTQEFSNTIPPGSLLVYNLKSSVLQSYAPPPTSTSISSLNATTLRFSNLRKTTVAVAYDSGGRIKLFDVNRLPSVSSSSSSSSSSDKFADDFNDSTLQSFEFLHNSNPITTLAFSPVNKLLLCSGSANGTLAFHDVEAGRVIKDIVIPRPSSTVSSVSSLNSQCVNSLEFNHDGITTMVGMSDGRTVLYDLRKADRPVWTSEGSDGDDDDGFNNDNDNDNDNDDDYDGVNDKDWLYDTFIYKSRGVQGGSFCNKVKTAASASLSTPTQRQGQRQVQGAVKSSTSNSNSNSNRDIIPSNANASTSTSTSTSGIYDPNNSFSFASSVADTYDGGRSGVTFGSASVGIGSVNGMSLKAKTKGKVERGGNGGGGRERYEENVDDDDVGDDDNHDDDDDGEGEGSVEPHPSTPPSKLKHQQPRQQSPERENVDGEGDDDDEEDAEFPRFQKSYKSAAVATVATDDHGNDNDNDHPPVNVKASSSSPPPTQNERSVIAEEKEWTSPSPANVDIANNHHPTTEIGNSRFGLGLSIGGEASGLGLGSGIMVNKLLLTQALTDSTLVLQDSFASKFSMLNLSMMKQFQEQSDEMNLAFRELRGEMKVVVEENRRLREENKKLKSVF